MSFRKRLIFALLTVLLFLGCVEGLGRIIWYRLERKSMDQNIVMGEKLLGNDVINFMKEADPHYGFRLKPGVLFEGTPVTNAQGFGQREPVSREKKPGVLRIVCVGESTTQGNNVDSNYPSYLRRITDTDRARNPTEVINAGVSGWDSDRDALRVELELADLRPDVVLLYLGWSEFQSYSPFRPAPESGPFESHNYLTRFNLNYGLRSVDLLAALLEKNSSQPAPPSAPTQPYHFVPSEHYRLLTKNMDRIVAGFRAKNPDVVVMMSTLVGVWPYLPSGIHDEPGKPRAYVPYWMNDNHVAPKNAVAYLARLNEVLRKYANEHGLLLVDSEKNFEHLDRGRLFWDFCHMLDDGYELLADGFYRALSHAHLLPGLAETRLAALRSKYSDGTHE